MDSGFPNVAHLKILRCLGSGSTSQVYEAFRLEDQSHIALKIIPLQSLPDEPARLRAEREAHVLQSIRHPLIRKMHRFYKDGQNLIFEMEYVDGSSLTNWMKQNRVPLLEPKLWILAQLAQALAIAHLEGIIHRDLKPDNVLISKAGELKLNDFGLSKNLKAIDCNATQPGLILGSLAYMAPEALKDGKHSFASDVFSFGVIAHELLQNAHPFPHDDVKSLIDAMHSGAGAARRLPFLSHKLESLLLDCLNRDPAQRPRSLWALHAELMTSIETSGIEARFPSFMNPASVDAVFLKDTLEHKHRRLKEQIEATIQRKPTDNKLLLQWMNEFALLFPQDRENRKHLSLLHEKRRPLIRYALWGMSALLLGASIFIAQDAPATGTLKIQVLPDAQVFIDGMPQEREALHALTLSPGLHRVVIKRDQFLPIERTIDIKSGVITKIQAMEESHE